jgi:hypothetical protein
MYFNAPLHEERVAVAISQSKVVGTQPGSMVLIVPVQELLVSVTVFPD